MLQFLWRQVCIVSDGLAAAGETLEEAAAVHGLDAAELEVEINDYLAKKEEQQA